MGRTAWRASGSGSWSVVRSWRRADGTCACVGTSSDPVTAGQVASSKAAIGRQSSALTCSARGESTIARTTGVKALTAARCGRRRRRAARPWRRPRHPPRILEQHDAVARQREIDAGVELAGRLVRARRQAGASRSMSAAGSLGRADHGGTGEDVDRRGAVQDVGERRRRLVQPPEPLRERRHGVPQVGRRGQPREQGEAAIVAWNERQAMPDDSTPAWSGTTTSAVPASGPAGSFVTAITRLRPRWMVAASTTSGVRPDARWRRGPGRRPGRSRRTSGTPPTPSGRPHAAPPATTSASNRLLPMPATAIRRSPGSTGESHASSR